MGVDVFYDALAPRYHLVYQDWDASIDRQGDALDSLLREHFPGERDVLDVAVGIGTQALGLAALGYRVIGSDLSPGAVHRARIEAARRGLEMPVYVADFQKPPVRGESVKVVLCCDNSLPHAASPDAILATLREWHRCLRVGGGCLISMRDYGEPPAPGTVEEHSYGERTWNGHRYAVRQLWTWMGTRYEMRLEMTPLDANAPPLSPLTTSYLAIAPARVQRLMEQAGFRGVQRMDGRFFQPVIVGFR